MPRTGKKTDHHVYVMYVVWRCERFAERAHRERHRELRHNVREVRDAAQAHLRSVVVLVEHGDLGQRPEGLRDAPRSICVQAAPGRVAAPVTGSLPWHAVHHQLLHACLQKL